MKLLFFLIIFFVATYSAIAQPNQIIVYPISGKIIDTSGNPISYATITLQRMNKGSVADALGVFSINAKMGDTLFITAVGYLGKNLVVGNNPKNSISLQRDNKALQDVTVKNHLKNMVTDTNEPTIIEKQFISNTLDDYMNSNGVTSTHSGGTNYGAPLPFFHHTDALKGNRYLFDTWVKGKVINMDDKVISNDSSLFNYDKILGNLLVTQDTKTIIEVDNQNIKSFELKSGQGYMVFEKIPFENQIVFFQVLAKADGKYVLYKSIKTKLKKNDYSNTGLIETGHNYDEYVDIPTYYIKQLLVDGTIKIIELKQKAIRDIFKTSTRANEYFNLHKNNVADEAFLIGLINFLD